MLLQSGFKNLEIVSKRRQDMPLIHFCIARRILNRKILTLLEKQIKALWMGFSPMQYGNLQCII